MEIENKIEYAIRLSNLGEEYCFEEYNLLASLCEEIYLMKKNGSTANSKLEKTFENSIILFFNNRGLFRSEVERYPLAKEYIKNIIE